MKKSRFSSLQKVTEIELKIRIYWQVRLTAKGLNHFLQSKTNRHKLFQLVVGIVKNQFLKWPLCINWISRLCPRVNQMLILTVRMRKKVVKVFRMKFFLLSVFNRHISSHSKNRCTSSYSTLFFYSSWIVMNFKFLKFLNIFKPLCKLSEN